MKANVGKVDKAIRIVLGIIILAAGFYFKSWWGIIGVIPLFTAFVSWCPLYAVFGFSTCPIKKSE